MKFFAVLLFLAIICFIRAQEDSGLYVEEDNEQQGVPPQQQQQQSIQMTQEIIESLWEILTPPCKTEMEGALGNQGDISMECKIEVQRGLIQLGVMQDPRAQQGQDPRAGHQVPPQQAQERVEAPSVPVEVSGTNLNVILAIVGLLVAIFGGAAAYVIQHNKTLPATEVKKPKKLSKQKVRTL